ncbi:Putative [ribosomal protein S18]-alanine N-acetyltransferase [Geodia barretti]|uniref:[ribosomal protein S18]-alanine N-acetyltransferase n=1 Tax=Geodia barretti TaxID=519541 RepID=A0AA35RUN9_GEOBA|nr:Putative [ribosomal protein S18]-alanine N-acetyltransferase [Geodia barretti]
MEDLPQNLSPPPSSTPQLLDTSASGTRETKPTLPKSPFGRPSEGNGIGELLLIGSLIAAREYGSHVMTLEARVSNFIAQRLYEKYSFKSVGIRKAYYADNREDAVIMTTTPIDSEEYGRMFQGLQETWESRWGPMIIEN